MSKSKKEIEFYIQQLEEYKQIAISQMQDGDVPIDTFQNIEYIDKKLKELKEQYCQLLNLPEVILNQKIDESKKTFLEIKKLIDKYDSIDDPNIPASLKKRYFDSYSEYENYISIKEDPNYVNKKDDKDDQDGKDGKDGNNINNTDNKDNDENKSKLFEEMMERINVINSIQEKVEQDDENNNVAKKQEEQQEQEEHQAKQEEQQEEQQDEQTDNEKIDEVISEESEEIEEIEEIDEETYEVATVEEEEEEIEETEEIEEIEEIDVKVTFPNMVKIYINKILKTKLKINYEQTSEDANYTLKDGKFKHKPYPECLPDEEYDESQEQEENNEENRQENHQEEQVDSPEEHIDSNQTNGENENDKNNEIKEKKKPKEIQKENEFLIIKKLNKKRNKEKENKEQENKEQDEIEDIYMSNSYFLDIYEQSNNFKANLNLINSIKNWMNKNIKNCNFEVSYFKDENGKYYYDDEIGDFFKYEIDSDDDQFICVKDDIKRNIRRNIRSNSKEMQNEIPNEIKETKNKRNAKDSLEKVSNSSKKSFLDSLKVNEVLETKDVNKKEENKKEDKEQEK